MKLRPFVVSFLVVVSLAAVWRAATQHQQLASARTELQNKRAEFESISGPSGKIVAETGAEALRPRESSGPPLELLELRAEVTRLMNRQRDLAGVTNENAQLRAQLDARRTNAPAAVALPPGYLLPSKAQWLGFDTPEHTMQSFLWAAAHRDFTNLLQALTPEMAEQLRSQAQQSPSFMKDFEQEVQSFPGLHILSRQQMPDGSVALQIEIIPGQPEGDPMIMRHIGGQWKMQMPR